MHPKVHKESIIAAGRPYSPDEIDNQILIETALTTKVFRVLHGEDEHYGLVVETLSLESSHESLRRVKQTATKLLHQPPALCVGVGKLPPVGEGEENIVRNELRVAVLNETFDTDDCKYAVTVVHDNIVSHNLRRPLSQPSFVDIRLSEAKEEESTCNTLPRTAKSVERWIRNKLVESHQIPPATAQTAQTLEEIGLASFEQVALVEEIESAFAITLPATATWEANTIGRLAELAFRLLKRTQKTA